MKKSKARRKELEFRLNIINVKVNVMLGLSSLSRTAAEVEKSAETLVPLMEQVSKLEKEYLDL